ncbi:DUF1206 domain-containing protein [Nocardioides mangrovi]|uniref:DUF1206 domain-containing protein n=1 Tax=Nocardioides mangrovi TaxID=2874580 RepID=A0ABS7UIY8_9ACTN|nr:DUF1206 domain-containing protein [Nocardioides mangrovi]MBZ5741003.1 DUF1206 domain-containing protein [Nocardioides mangrovi]
MAQQNMSAHVDRATNAAKGAAAQAGDHPVVEWGARLGYAASGVLHLVLAWLIAQIAVGAGAHASQSGAVGTLARQPFGQFLLWVLVAGFALLALWQATEVVTSREAFDKAKAGGKTVLYAALAWTAGVFAVGGHTSSNKQTQDFTRTLMDAPAGRLLVGLVGLAIVGVAIYHIYKGWKKKFLEDLQEHPGRWAVVAARVGYIGKGIALVAVGFLFITAAWQQQAGDVTGLDGALKSLRDLPAGAVLLIGIALGFAAYGVYSFARGRYARV